MKKDSPLLFPFDEKRTLDSNWDTFLKFFIVPHIIIMKVSFEPITVLILHKEDFELVFSYDVPNRYFMYPNSDWRTRTDDQVGERSVLWNPFNVLEMCGVMLLKLWNTQQHSEIT